ncbi:hypothetical protein BDW02DRAFT_592514 [Decorospora gaudefroyi]|uniref:Uncharacterized protein n=1 Tax=Decorospora gaudefroyi TaxID=184978 RepID=A0A6A5K4F1_9PLEO|nr:hypothetical protein BDW02DRAFT_592514 [Decorospora gaudefroyi]
MLQRHHQLQEVKAKKLYPRLVLFKALSRFKDKSKPRHRSHDPICDARRDFLDAFAYLCDIQKDGKTVTAAALQKLTESNFLWLAANEGISDDIMSYAGQVLKQLKTANAENRRFVQDAIFNLAVEKCASRIRFYKNQVRNHARSCVMTLENRERDEIVTLLRRKLGRLAKPPANFTTEAYVDLCYDMRSEEINHIKAYSSKTDDDFEKLAHYTWRIGATRAAANIVVEAMLALPSLRRISHIRRVDEPVVVQKTLHATCTSPHKLLHRIFTDSASRNPLSFQQPFHRLYELDPPLTRPIHTVMTASENIVTRVHAELQIADTFSRAQDIKFVDNDKYIGCSKPACYFCYTWLCNHKHRYVEPATHYKVIPGCRGPDHDLNESGAGVMVEMYGRVSRQVGQDILEFLQRSGESRVQYMSTDAGSRAPSRLSVLGS